MRPPRHKNSHAREIALQALYQADIGNQPIADLLQFRWLNEPLDAEEKVLTVDIIQGVIDHGGALDQVVQSCSSVEFSQISSIVRCILKMGIFEMRTADRDPAIIVDDLLNLARRYDGEQAVAFVNGVLDRYRKEMQAMSVRQMTGSSDETIHP